MKTQMTRVLTLIVLTAINAARLGAADNPTKEQKEAAKAEEKMKEDKRREEQSARDYADRVKVARFDSVWRAPKTEDIDVFQIGETAVKPHKVIALLTFDCAVQDETQAVAGFIEKSKDLGADGVVLLGFVMNQERQTVISPGDRRVFRANAIVFPAK